MADPLQPLISQQQGTNTRLLAAMQAFLRKFEINSDQMLPAKVIAYDRAKNLATIQPLIVLLDVNNKQIERNQVTQIPVFSMGAGNFHINFPVKANDLGWIVANDRDISLFKQSLAQSAPNTARLHVFEDGMFFPDVMRQYTIAGEDADAMVIQSTDSQTKVSIRSDNILIAAPSHLLVRVPQTEFTGDVTVDGNLTVEKQTVTLGGFSAAEGSACTLPTSATVGSIQVFTHSHGGVQRGGDITNPFNA